MNLEKIFIPPIIAVICAFISHSANFQHPFSLPRGVFRHMDFRTLYCPASLHAEGFQHLVHAFNILYDAVLAADSEADIKRVDEGELRHAR